MQRRAIGPRDRFPAGHSNQRMCVVNLQQRFEKIPLRIAKIDFEHRLGIHRRRERSLPAFTFTLRAHAQLKNTPFEEASRDGQRGRCGDRSGGIHCFLRAALMVVWDVRMVENVVRLDKETRRQASPTTC